MKILLTTHQFLPDYTSGTEVLTFEVARELTRLGHQVRILTGWPHGDDIADGRLYDEYRYEGLQVHRLHPSPASATTISERARAEFDNPAAAAAFTALVRSWRPDIVHFFHLQRLSSSIPARCAQLSIPTVYTATDFWSICPLIQLRLPNDETCPGPEPDSANCILHLAARSSRGHLAPLYRWVPSGLVGAVLRIAPLDEQNAPQNLGAARALQQRPATMRRMLNTIDRIIAPTSYMAERLRAFGAADEAIVEMGYGIDTASYATPASLLTGGRVRIGFIGTLQEHKGAHVLVDAVRLLDPALDCSVSIYGDETFYPDYVAQIRASAEADPRIRFCGTFKRVQLPRVLGELDVLVVPSTWSENTPLVIFAAQAAARPVIGSNVAGIASVVTDGVNGRLFEVGNAQALSALLAEAIERPETLRAMSKRAIRAKDIRPYVADLLDVYEGVFAERALYGSEQAGQPA